MIKFALSLPKLTAAQIQNAVDQYFACGVTTTQDILLNEMEAKVYNKLGDDFPLDVNAYFWINPESPGLATFQRVIATYNTTRFKTRGGKFLLDGSLQGYTGLLTQPYWVPKDLYTEDLDNFTYDSSRSCAT